jgi:glutaredoxin 3
VLKLYNLESCPYCIMVRNKLNSLGLDYEKIDVHPWQGQRQEVFEVSGQYTVPVLIDDGRVFDDENDIIAHLTNTYQKEN